LYFYQSFIFELNSYNICGKVTVSVKTLAYFYTIKDVGFGSEELQAKNWKLQVDICFMRNAVCIVFSNSFCAGARVFVAKS